MNTITLETYPDMFTDYDEFIENENYDKQKREFGVKIAWLADYVYHTWGVTLGDFFKTNTWDENWQLYEMARLNGALKFERIVER